jgi:hypothetical protein
MNPETIDAFAAIVGPENLLTAREDILPYGFDGTASIKGTPAAVVFPKDTAEVAACVRLAAERGVPVVGRGSGTGLSGGGPWPVLSAGSGVAENQHHRRQRGGELRRLARDEIRRHTRPCDGTRSGALRWCEQSRDFQPRMPAPPRQQPACGRIRHLNHSAGQPAGPGLSQRSRPGPSGGTSRTQ